VSEDAWDRLAEFYDWEHEGFAEDLSLYLAYARRAGDPILEAACGTGRVLLPLAGAGFRVVGIDTSSAMLERARAKLTELPEQAAARVRLLRAVVRQADMGGRFALAILALDALGLFLDVGEQLDALRALAGQLRRGGLLVADVTNGAARGPEPRDEVRLLLTRPHPSTGRPVSKWVARRTDPAEQRDELTYLYDELDVHGRVRRSVVQHALRYFHRHELVLLFERAGLRVDGVFGDYALGPHTADAERMIVVARRPDSP
jgi:SAM-dependent methyltransferase